MTGIRAPYTRKSKSIRLKGGYHVIMEAPAESVGKLKKCICVGGLMERIGIMWCCMNPKCNRVLEITDKKELKSYV